MKAIFLAAMTLLPALAACTTEHTSNPFPSSELVSRAEAVDRLNKGGITTVSQTHALWVGFFHGDGSSFVARAPYIDAVFDEVSKCPVCEEITPITE